MPKINFKTVWQYLYDQLTGNFLGFLIGASATGLVSQFFETRGLKNLWGLTAKKTVIDKSTFQNLEWIISIVIGFIAFEVVTKVIKARLEQHSPKIKRVLFRRIIAANLHEKARSFNATFATRRVQFFSAVHHGVKRAVNRFSSR